MSNALIQAVKFAAVGASATLVHVSTAIVLNNLLDVPPLRANIGAFIVAFAVSYSGNWIWTFAAASLHRLAFPRFLALALTGFALNQAIVFIVVEVFKEPLWLAMVPVTLIIPPFSFWLSRTKVFIPVSPQS